MQDYCSISMGKGCSSSMLALFRRGCSWSAVVVGSDGNFSLAGCVHKDEIL